MKFFRVHVRLKNRTLSDMEAENIIAEIVGPDAFAKLAAVHGGTDLRIPGEVNSGPGKALVELIGAEAAERLIFWGRSGRVYIPERRTSNRQRRAADVVALHRSGMTVPEISRTYRFESRYSERQIYQLLREQTA